MGRGKMRLQARRGGWRRRGNGRSAASGAGNFEGGGWSGRGAGSRCVVQLIRDFSFWLHGGGGGGGRQQKVGVRG